MEPSDYEPILNEIGQVYVQMRKDCLIGCANLLDTHEVTLTERNCMKNCFKKLYYANNNFQKLTADNLPKINELKDVMFEYYYKA